MRRLSSPLPSACSLIHINACIDDIDRTYPILPEDDIDRTYPILPEVMCKLSKAISVIAFQFDVPFPF